MSICKSGVSTAGRRDFLHTTLTATAGVAVAVVTSRGVAAVIDEDQDAQQPIKKKGYRVTQHVIDYYKSASF